MNRLIGAAWQAVIAILASSTVLSGCSTQPAQVINAQSADIKVEGSKVIAPGCTFDIKKFCQALIERDEIVFNDVHYDWKNFTQNFPAHTYIYYSLAVHDGPPIGEVECFIASQQRKVLSAGLLPQQPITSAGMEYLKSAGACDEQNPVYSKLFRPHP